MTFDLDVFGLSPGLRDPILRYFRERDGLEVGFSLFWEEDGEEGEELLPELLTAEKVDVEVEGVVTELEIIRCGPKDLEEEVGVEGLRVEDVEEGDWGHGHEEEEDDDGEENDEAFLFLVNLLRNLLSTEEELVTGSHVHSPTQHLSPLLCNLSEPPDDENVEESEDESGSEPNHRRLHDRIHFPFQPTRHSLVLHEPRATAPSLRRAHGLESPERD